MFLRRIPGSFGWLSMVGGLALAITAGCTAQVEEDEEGVPVKPGVTGRGGAKGAGPGVPLGGGGGDPMGAGGGAAVGGGGSPGGGGTSGRGGTSGGGAGSTGNRDGGAPLSGDAAAAVIIPIVRDLRVSPGRGFYDAPISVAVTIPTVPDAVIRYTTDGTPPTATTGSTYGGPIAIKSTTTLRVAAFKDGAVTSYVDTHTYLFLDDVIKQSPDGVAPPGWPAAGKVNAQIYDYGMDPDVVNDPRYSGTLKADMKTIPTMSIVMKLPDLVEAKAGIYSNPSKDTQVWERPASLELIRPDGVPGFQINAGIRIRGGFSRSADNPKHAFRFFFRKVEYGEGKLRYPLFKGGTKEVVEFDKFDLRCAQNYSWAFQGDSRGIFLRDQFSRDSQLAMGHDGERGDFYHLYINGQYWGLYNTDERPGAEWAADYWGGKSADYDTVKVDPAKGYTLYATDGDMTAWTTMYNTVKAAPVNDAMFFRLQGLNPAGVRDMAIPNLLDVDNLIDYILLAAWGGNFDAPVSRFLNDESPNNSFHIRPKTGAFGFRFISHDSEHTMITHNVMVNGTTMNVMATNRLGPFAAGNNDVTKSNAHWFFQRLWTSPEAKLRIADRSHKHLFNGGALTPDPALARFNRRKNEIDRAVVAESARWGDAKRGTNKPYTRDDQWIKEVDNVVKTWFPVRTGILIAQLKTAGLYPMVPGTAFSKNGGTVTKGTAITIMPIEATTGMIYVTTDGSDPRAIGGALATTAKVYAAPVPIPASLVLKARVKAGDVWSALTEASFTAN